MTRKSADARLFDPDPPGGSRVLALERAWSASVRALRAGGKLEDSDAALIAVGRYVNRNADEARADTDESRYVKTQTLKLALDAATRLYARTDPGDTGPDFDAYFAALLHAADDPAQ